MAPLPSVGQLPEAARGADPTAADGLTPLLYKELHRLARRHLVGQRRGHTRGTTDLVNEAYLKPLSPT